MGLDAGYRVLDFGNQFAELRTVTEARKILVCHQAIHVLIAAIDSFAQNPECVVGTIGGRCDAGEAIPWRPAVFLPPGLLS